MSLDVRRDFKEGSSVWRLSVCQARCWKQQIQLCRRVKIDPAEGAQEAEDSSSRRQKTSSPNPSKNPCEGSRKQKTKHTEVDVYVDHCPWCWSRRLTEQEWQEEEQRRQSKIGSAKKDALPNGVDGAAPDGVHPDGGVGSQALLVAASPEPVAAANQSQAPLVAASPEPVAAAPKQEPVAPEVQQPNELRDQFYCFLDFPELEDDLLAKQAALLSAEQAETEKRVVEKTKQQKRRRNQQDRAVARAEGGTNHSMGNVDEERPPRDVVNGVVLPDISSNDESSSSDGEEETLGAVRVAKIRAKTVQILQGIVGDVGEGEQDEDLLSGIDSTALISLQSRLQGEFGFLQSKLSFLALRKFLRPEALVEHVVSLARISAAKAKSSDVGGKRESADLLRSASPVSLAQSESLATLNSFFQKKIPRAWTGGETFRQVDGGDFCTVGGRCSSAG